MTAESDAQAMLCYAAKLIDECRLGGLGGGLGGSSSSDFNERYLALFGVVTTGDFQDRIKAAARGMRSNYANLVSKSTCRALMDPVLLNYARAVGYPETSSEAILRRLAQRFALAESGGVQTVKYRNFSLGTITAGGSNAGSGVIRRLDYDEWGYRIEATSIEAKSMECISDQNTNRGTKGKEVFRFKGANPAMDAILADASTGTPAPGSGIDTTLTGQVADDGIVQNPSFSRYTTATVPAAASAPVAPTDISNWDVYVGGVIDTFTNLLMDVDTFYRASGRGDTTPTSLHNNAVQTFKIVQSLQNFNQTLDWTKPYQGQVAVYRAGSATGNVTFRVGAVEVTATLASMNNAAWNILSLDSFTTTDRKKMWPRNMAEQNATIEVELDSLGSGGSVYIDDICVHPMVQIDSLWYSAIGGATPWLIKDTFSWTDALAASDSVLQRVLAYIYELTLPNASAATAGLTDL